MPSDITATLTQYLLERDATGLKKYGVSLDRRDLTVEQWLDHQTEELLDGAGYAQAAKREIVAMRARIKELEELVARLEVLLRSQTNRGGAVATPPRPQPHPEPQPQC